MSTPATVTAAELAAETLATAPAASGAPAPTPPATAPTMQAPPEKDALGRQFDPAKFRPEKDTLGRWKNLRSGPGRGRSSPARSPIETPAQAPDATAAGSTSFVAPDAPAPPMAHSPDRFDMAAEVYTRAGYSVADGLCNGNGEWLPENDGEHIALRGALATYLRHKQSDDLPPGLALALAISTYGAKRVSKPRTATRLRLFANWLRARLWAWRTGQRLDSLPTTPEPPPAESGPLPPQVNLPASDSSGNVTPFPARQPATSTP